MVLRDLRSDISDLNSDRHPPELTNQQSQSSYTESGHQYIRVPMTAFACADGRTRLGIVECYGVLDRSFSALMTNFHIWCGF